MDTQSEQNTARIIENDTKPSPFSRQGIIEIIKFILLAVCVVIPVRMFVMQPFIVSGSSMFPTFKDGQYLIVDELSYHFREPARGDVIVFKPPMNLKTYYIKRIIGLPGETVIINGANIIIKNEAHPQGFILTQPYIETPSDDKIEKTLGPDEYYVLGDNRTASSDSRYWGTLPRKDITGRAFLRLFPFTQISYLPGEYHQIEQ
ncbi:signal peptidase I [Candidatus Nomurabacteria bacterium]|nr:signal peptidase I [Candidatus Nomurabacteria bacterium]